MAQPPGACFFFFFFFFFVLSRGHKVTNRAGQGQLVLDVSPPALGGISPRRTKLNFAADEDLERTHPSEIHVARPSIGNRPPRRAPNNAKATIKFTDT